MKEKVFFVHEISEQGVFFFEDPSTYDEGVVKKRWNEQGKSFIETLKSTYSAMDSWNAADCEAAFKSTAEQTGINPGHVMQLFRVCVSGQAGGPVLFEMVALLGKDVVVRRLDNALKSITN